MRKLATWIASHLPQGLKTRIHNSRNLDNILRRVYGRALGSTPLAIEDGPMKGILLAPGEHVSHAHLAGTYERDLVDALARHLRPGMVCYDIGASIGYSSLLMARQAKAVYAFEPSPTAAAEIRRHQQANGFENIEIVSNPVTDRVTTIDFAVTDVAYGSSIDWQQEHKQWKSIALETTTLDLFLQDHPPPDLLKMDIEGEEGRALAGARELLRHHPLIFCELHSLEAAQASCAVLQEAGYRVEHLSGGAFDPSRQEIIPGMLQIVALPPVANVRQAAAGG